jgi:beta-galactosidase
MHHATRRALIFMAHLTLHGCTPSPAPRAASSTASVRREHLSINEGWRFHKYASAKQADDLIYDVRPEVRDPEEEREADARPTEALSIEATQTVL